jgi:hypothetical protein
VPGAAVVGAGDPESLPCRPSGVGGFDGAMLAFTMTYWRDMPSTARILRPVMSKEGRAESELKEGRVATRRSRPIFFLSSSLKSRYVPKDDLI